MTTPNSNVLPQPIDVDATISVAIAGPVEIAAHYDNGTQAPNLQVTEKGALKTEIVGPVAGFGEMYTVEPDPRFQIDAVYGADSYDVDTLTSGAGSSAGASGGIFSVSSGTASDGYAFLWSHRFVRHASGQSTRYRFTAAFGLTGAADSVQVAGAMTKTNGLLFGWVNGVFGVTRVVGGAQQIVRLTITNGATSAANITVTLNGVAFTVASGGVLSTTATAEKIAEAGVFTGWMNHVSPTANGATVTFIQDMPATAAGTYSVSGAGVVGTFATILAGAPNDYTTNFVAQTSWNVDRMDGSNSANNPSGATLNLDKLNVYQITYPYLGAGTINFYVMSPQGRFILVHQMMFPGTSTVASQRNPSMRGGWAAINLGSTTSKTVSGASAAGLVEGAMRAIRNPFGHDHAVTGVGTTEYAAIALRVRGEFGGIVNMREVLPKFLTLSIDTANRIVRARCYINPTLTGTVNWGYIDSTHSVVEHATPTSITPTNGQLVAVLTGASGAPSFLDLQLLDLRINPGDTFVIALSTIANSTDCTLSVNWEEK